MATFEVRRPGSIDYLLKDLGQDILAGETIDLLPLHGPYEIANSDNLESALQSGALIRVKNSIDIPYAEAFRDLILTQEAPYISASWADSEADRAQSLARLISSFAIVGDSIGDRAESLARINNSSEALSIANRSQSLARTNSPSEAASIGERAESLARYYKPITETPPSDPGGGDRWIDPITFLEYIYDSTREYWIGTSRNWIRYSGDGPTGNQYLTTGGWVSANYIYVPYDAIILEIYIYTLSGNNTKTFYFRNDTVDLFSRVLPSSNVYTSSTEEVLVSSGTLLTVFVGSDGQKVASPEVQVYYARRVSPV